MEYFTHREASTPGHERRARSRSTPRTPRSGKDFDVTRDRLADSPDGGRGRACGRPRRRDEFDLGGAAFVVVFEPGGVTGHPAAERPRPLVDTLLTVTICPSSSGGSRRRSPSPLACRVSRRIAARPRAAGTLERSTVIRSHRRGRSRNALREAVATYARCSSTFRRVRYSSTLMSPAERRSSGRSGGEGDRTRPWRTREMTTMAIKTHVRTIIVAIADHIHPQPPSLHTIASSSGC